MIPGSTIDDVDWEEGGSQEVCLSRALEIVQNGRSGGRLSPLNA